MPVLADALSQVGIDLGTANSLTAAISDFNQQNLSPSDLARISSLDAIASRALDLTGNLNVGTRPFSAANGEWISLHYADDLNSHHPKFKFLFKVNFNGFPGGTFSYFIYRCDKPKVRFNHTEVNYYNFRTKVLTSMAFEPLSFTFLDEIGNTVNSFFSIYLKERSNQGAGKASIVGGTEHSSTINYANGYSAGRTIEIQQIFANGLATNIFRLINPRIEMFEFDDLNMELNQGSFLTCVVSYDALECETTGAKSINSWGATDLYRGGGTSGPENAGASSIEEDGPLVHSSASGGGIGGNSTFLTKSSTDSFETAIRGISSLSVPPSLQDLIVPDEILSLNKFNQEITVNSTGDVLSSSIQGTLDSIKNGSNLKFGGS